jgi:hypothetical protein
MLTDSLARLSESISATIALDVTLGASAKPTGLYSARLLRCPRATLSFVSALRVTIPRVNHRGLTPPQCPGDGHACDKQERAAVLRLATAGGQL